jgi:hypothetical protein
MMTIDSASPGTSTHSQKLCEAQSTEGASTNFSSNARRGAARHPASTPAPAGLGVVAAQDFRL